MEIPDKNNLTPDYDADLSTKGKPYFKRYGPQEKSPISDMPAMGLSREVGKWSYKGRIPASFIRYVYYYKPYEKKWHRSKPETWAKLLNSYDWETIGYKLELGEF